MRRALTAVLFLLFITTHSVFAQAQPGTPREMFDMINEARKANGVGLLAWNEDLAAAAQAHAEDIATNPALGHTGSDGSTVADRVARTPFQSYSNRIMVSENWSMGTALDVMKFFLEDQIHRDNLLLPIWREVGVGRATYNETGELWVVDFGAQPGVYPIFVNGDAERTTERTVTVDLRNEEAGFAPDIFTSIAEIRVADARQINDAVWIPFQPQVTVELVAGGGEHAVVAEFRDSEGHIVQSVDTIYLVEASGPLPTARVALAPTLTPSVTPSPTNTPTVTPSPTATATPTVTPTATPTPTPTPLFAAVVENPPLLIGAGIALLLMGILAGLLIAGAGRRRR